MNMDFFNRLAAAAVKPGGSIRPRRMSRFETPAESPTEEETNPSENLSESHAPTLTEPYAPAPELSLFPPAFESMENQEKKASTGQSMKTERNARRTAATIPPGADPLPQRPRPAERMDQNGLLEQREPDLPEKSLPVVDIGPIPRQKDRQERGGEVTDQPLQSIRPAALSPPSKANDAEPPPVKAKIDRPRDENTDAMSPEMADRSTPSHTDAVPSTPDIVRPRQAPAPDRSGAVEAQRKTTADQPSTIEISIGKIELRPQPSAKMPPPAARPAYHPPLSLDDYLARRRGGEP